MRKIWAAEKECARSVKVLPKTPAATRCPPINHILFQINLSKVQFISPPFSKLSPSHVSRAKASDKIVSFKKQIGVCSSGMQNLKQWLTEWTLKRYQDLILRKEIWFYLDCKAWELGNCLISFLNPVFSFTVKSCFHHLCVHHWLISRGVSQCTRSPLNPSVPQLLHLQSWNKISLRFWLLF